MEMRRDCCSVIRSWPIKTSESALESFRADRLRFLLLVFPRANVKFPRWLLVSLI